MVSSVRDLDFFCAMHFSLLLITECESPAANQLFCLQYLNPGSSVILCQVVQSAYVVLCVGIPVSLDQFLCYVFC